MVEFCPNEGFPIESSCLEYKRERTNDSKKYLKTVIAFANGAGGTLIFGIDDKTCAVTGLDPNSVWQEIEAISNAISDNCEPLIIPQFEIKQVGQRAIISVFIPTGMYPPYFLKSLGLPKGVFVRSGSTTRPADSSRLRELLLAGKGRSLDSIELNQEIIDPAEAETLCKTLTSVAKQHASEKDPHSMIQDLTTRQLLAWGVLVERNGKWHPTYAYNLLVGRDIPELSSGIKCAVFKGDTRSVFLDRRFYDGPVYQQIDDAYKFVLRNIRLNAFIDGLYRKDQYELPPTSIRELITNAVCHRSYLHPSKIQVALYDNRLEITSPGILNRYFTLDKLKEGFNLPQNTALAKVFKYLGLIEDWGSGIPRMYEDCKTWALREPSLRLDEDVFQVVLYRRDAVDAMTPPTSTPPAVADPIPDHSGQNQLNLPAVEEMRSEWAALLEFCEIPRTLAEMMSFLNLSNRQSFRNRHLSPLIKSGRIVMTIPDKPKSPNQRYVAVKPSPDHPAA